MVRRRRTTTTTDGRHRLSLASPDDADDADVDADAGVWRRTRAHCTRKPEHWTHSERATTRLVSPASKPATPLTMHRPGRSCSPLRRRHLAAVSHRHLRRRCCVGVARRRPRRWLAVASPSIRRRLRAISRRSSSISSTFPYKWCATMALGSSTSAAHPLDPATPHPIEPVPGLSWAERSAYGPLTVWLGPGTRAPTRAFIGRNGRHSTAAANDELLRVDWPTRVWLGPSGLLRQPGPVTNERLFSMAGADQWRNGVFGRGLHFVAGCRRRGVVGLAGALPATVPGRPTRSGFYYVSPAGMLPSFSSRHGHGHVLGAAVAVAFGWGRFLSSKIASTPSQYCQ